MWQILKISLLTFVMLLVVSVISAHMIDPDFDILDDFRKSESGKRKLLAGLGRAAAHAYRYYGWRPLVGLALLAAATGIVVDRIRKRKEPA